MARQVVPDAARSYGGIPRNRYHPVSSFVWAGLVAVESEPNLPIINRPGTQRAVYQALKRGLKQRKQVKNLRVLRIKERKATA